MRLRPTPSNQIPFAFIIPYVTARKRYEDTRRGHSTLRRYADGSVGAGEIIDALKTQEITLSSDQIKLEGPLKELGLYTVNVQLHPSVTTELKVWVVPAVGEDESK